MASRAWNDTLLVSRIIAAMVQAERLGMTISASDAFERQIADQCRHQFGNLTSVVQNSVFDKSRDRSVMTPQGHLMTSLWDALKVVREEWLTLRMIEAGFVRRWIDVGGEAGRRAHEHYRSLDEACPSVEAAIIGFQANVRAREGIAA